MKDDIVEEIHQTRERLLAEFQGDLEKLLNSYRTMESQDKDRVVTLEDVRKRRTGSFDGTSAHARPVKREA